MNSTRFLLGVLALTGFAGASRAQCPVQELVAQVPDLGHFGLDIAVSGSRALIGSEREQAAFLFEEVGGVWQPAGRLRSPEPADASLFGTTVALSGDTAVVSDQRSPDQGKLHVYVRAGADWALQATLVPADGEPGDFFGGAVAIDGDTIVARKYVGFEWAVHVFERSGSTWQETAKLTRPGLHFFGFSLALSGDTLLVGDAGDQDDGFNAGAAYFYERQASGWSQTRKVFAATPFADAMFGASVALSGDTAVVGAPAYFRADRTGAACVFERVAGDWVARQELRAEERTPGAFVGADVSIRGDRILLGAPGDAAADNPGGVYVFERSGATFVQTGKLRRPAGGDGHDRFGQAVALAGEQALVGSPDGGAGTERGATHVFDLTLNRPVSYCQSTPNSTGQAARIASIGSHLVPADDVTLRATGVPDQAGFFIIAGQAGQRPLFDGFLCVGRPLARLPMVVAQGQQLVSHVDLADAPLPVLPGSSWSFQAWFLDPAAGGTGANLSNGVTVTFCP